MTAVRETPEIDETLERFPFDDGRGIDVNERFRDLRERDGLLKVRMAYGEPTWLVTRYDDARLVLGDPRFSRYLSVGRDSPRQAEAQDQAGLITLDAPEHTRLRTLLLKAFNRSRIEAQHPAIRALAEGLLAERMAAGRAWTSWATTPSRSACCRCATCSACRRPTGRCSS